MAVRFMGVETGVHGENHQHAASHCQTLSDNVVSITPRLSKIQITTLVVIGTDFIDNCTSNYHTIMATTIPNYLWR